MRAATSTTKTSTLCLLLEPLVWYEHVFSVNAIYYALIMPPKLGLEKAYTLLYGHTEKHAHKFDEMN